MKKKYVLSLIAAVLIGVGLFALKNYYTENKQKKEYCEKMINGSDPYYGFPKGYAMRQYYHCILSSEAYREKINCYQKYRQVIIDCQQSSKEKMSEEEIILHLTGGGMDKICQDTEKICTKSQNSSDSDADENLKKAMLIFCVEKTRKACDDLGIKWK